MLTDQEAAALANLCPPHKIILDGGGLLGMIDSACRVAYKVDDLIQDNPELHEIARQLGMAMHEAEKQIGLLVKKLVLRAAQIEYGPKS